MMHPNDIYIVVCISIGLSLGIIFIRNLIKKVSK